MKLKSSIANVSVAISLALGPAPSVACEMPDQRIIEQTFLNLKYPQAMFVTGATWAMQQSGLLDMPDRERIVATGARRAELDRAALSDALNALGSLGVALHSASRQDHRISLVLVERMHWERFLPTPDTAYDPAKIRCFIPCKIEVEREEDLVLVTSEPVLHAIRKGVLRISEAVELSLMRLYGTEEQVSAFLLDFGAVGAHRLEPYARGGFPVFDPLFQHTETSLQQASPELLSSK